MIAHGIFSRVPAEEYFGMPGTSISRLKELRRSPQHYRHGLVQPKESAPLALGRAAHCAVLEPERFVREYAVWARRAESGNLCPRNGRHWDEFRAKYPGREIITEDEAIAAIGIQHAVREDEYAKRYLESGEPEVVMRWQMAGRECRGRLDWLTRTADLKGVVRPHLLGLKTTSDCRDFMFSRQGHRYGYHLQWGFYLDGYKTLKEEEPRVVEIVVETEPPHAVMVYEIPEDVIEQGREEYEELLRLLDDCERRDHWPGPGGAGETIFRLPAYAYPQTDDISELGLEA